MKFVSIKIQQATQGADVSSTNNFSAWSILARQLLYKTSGNRYRELFHKKTILEEAVRQYDFSATVGNMKTAYTHSSTAIVNLYSYFCLILTNI